jgi:hypothetical protein
MLSNMGVLYCGDVIGKDGRVCILIACTVAGHRAKKCWPFVAKGDPSDTTLLCISCASVGGSGKPSSVFVEPTIPLEKLSLEHATTRRRLEDAFPVSAKPPDSRRVGGAVLDFTSCSHAHRMRLPFSL